MKQCQKVYPTNSSEFRMNTGLKQVGYKYRHPTRIQPEPHSHPTLPFCHPERSIVIPSVVEESLHVGRDDISLFFVVLLWGRTSRLKLGLSGVSSYTPHSPHPSNHAASQGASGHVGYLCEFLKIIQKGEREKMGAGGIQRLPCMVSMAAAVFLLCVSKLTVSGD